MLLDSNNEWKKRKNLSMVAMRKMNKIWTSNIVRPRKVRIYKAYIQSVMLFGCSTWSMNIEMERSIDSFNKAMVRHACGIFWPKHMSIEETFSKNQQNVK